MKNLFLSFGTFGRTSFCTLQMQSLIDQPWLTVSLNAVRASSFKSSCRFDSISFKTSSCNLLETKFSYPLEAPGPALTVTRQGTVGISIVVGGGRLCIIVLGQLMPSTQNTLFWSHKSVLLAKMFLPGVYSVNRYIYWNLYQVSLTIHTIDSFVQLMVARYVMISLCLTVSCSSVTMSIML